MSCKYYNRQRITGKEKWKKGSQQRLHAESCALEDLNS